MGSTYQSIVIDAPPQQVWEAIRNFHDASWAPNVIKSLETVGEASGDQIGAGRVLNGVFHETLREVDEAGHAFSYTIDEGPSPISSAEISDYVGRVEVKASPDGAGSLVEWTSSWQNNDEAGYEFCHPIYMALLGDMKASLEGA
jgi:carbon monoxide dehydrogenase subunit G